MIHNIALAASGLATGILAGSVLAQSEPPADLVTFQWLAITVLAGAIGTLFWQYIKMRDSNLIKVAEFLSNYHDALTGNTEALRELKYAITDVANLNKLDQRLVSLENRLEKRRSDRREG